MAFQCCVSVVSRGPLDIPPLPNRGSGEASQGRQDTVTWIDVPDNAKCADCLAVIDDGRPCQHTIYRPDEALSRTYLYTRAIAPCFCQCGVDLVTGIRASATDRTRNEFSTIPLWYIRQEMGIEQPPGTRAPQETRCDCGRYLLPEDMVTVTGRYGDTIRICEPCRARTYTRCQGCGDWTHQDYVCSVVMRDSEEAFESYCSPCVSNFTRCSHCNHYSRPGDEGTCCGVDVFGIVADCHCYDCESARRNVIHSYSFRPAPAFAGVPTLDGEGNDRTPYMGFELEVEVSSGRDRSSAALELRQAGEGRIYLKEDGSINHGFEIVTHPASLDWYQNEFPWQKIRDMRSDRTIHTADNCGLHVHVSRAAFSGPSHDYRWFLFWYRNQNIMNLLAGRESTYAEYNPTHRSTLKEVAARSGNAASVGRYTAINTSGTATYEVRVFASTLYVNRIKAALQLVDGTVEYTRQLRSAKVLQDGGFAFDSFMEWMMSTSPRRYAELIRRVEDVTRGRNFQRRTFTTDSWRALDAYGRSNWERRTMVTQEEKATA